MVEEPIRDAVAERVRCHVRRLAAAGEVVGSYVGALGEPANDVVHSLRRHSVALLRGEQRAGLTPVQICP